MAHGLTTSRAAVWLCWPVCSALPQARTPRACASPAPSTRRRWTRTRWRCCTTRASPSRSTTRWSIATSSSSSSRRWPLSWQAVNPTTWRFKLRPGVTFHDGTPFTADDAVFSIERALAAAVAARFQLKGVSGAQKVDELTLDILLEAPDAVLPEKLR